MTSLLLLALVLTPADDEADADPLRGPGAHLVLQLDARGGADATLSLLAPPPEADRLIDALRQTLGGSLAQPSVRTQSGLWVLRAHSDGFRRRGLVVSGRLDLPVLAGAVRPAGARHLLLYLRHPGAGFSRLAPDLPPRTESERDTYSDVWSFEVSGTGGRPETGWLHYDKAQPHNPVTHWQYAAPLSLAEASPLELAYGYRLRDLGPLAPIPALLVLPLSLTWWRRRAALHSTNDPTVVWFGYWRFLRWLVIGTELGWLAAVFGLDVRSHLDRLVGFLLNRPPEPTGLRAALLALHVEGFDFGWGTACFYLLPPVAVVVLCVALSHPVFTRVRGLELSRGRLVWQTLAAQLPLLSLLLFGFAGVGALFAREPRRAVLWFAAASAGWLIGLRLQTRATGQRPHALLEGDLRDRVFALAEKAGVKVKQVYVLLTGPGREANAAAVLGDQVVLTDHLLAQLSKREVDAIVAHELAHLQGRHPRALLFHLGLSLLAFLLVPALVALAVFLLPRAFDGWEWDEDRVRWLRWLPVLLPLLLLTGLAAVRTFRQRRFERAADAGAVALTGDAEALITALARLARLNLLPMQWGKWEGRLLTHPSTSGRIQAIAQAGGLSPERVRDLLAAEAEAEHYALPPAVTRDDKVFSTAFKQGMTARVTLAVTALTVLAPAVWAWLTGLRLDGGGRSGLLWGAGLVLTVGLYLTAVNWLPVRGYDRMRRRLRDRLGREGLPVEAWGGAFVGFAPAGAPRLYEGFFDWDVGFLVPAGDRLAYLGEQTRFALRREQVTDVRVGQGPPNWFGLQAVYVTWREDTGGEARTFTVRPGAERSLWQLRREVPRLAERLRTWREPATTDPPPAPLAELGPLRIGTVTSLSPRDAVSRRSLLGGLILVLVAAAAACVGFGVPFGWSEGGAAWGVLAVVALLVLLQPVPYWRYREPAG
jgi:Zn-dependent protease with chaperone function